MKLYFVSIVLLFASVTYSQNYYFLSSLGNDNNSGLSEQKAWKSISKLNKSSLKSGDVVNFKSGDQFADDKLECKGGVTYTTYGGSEKAIIGDYKSSSQIKTILVNNEDVTIDNLRIYGFKDASRVIVYYQGGLTIKNCEIFGGENAHSKYTIGIKAENTGIKKTVMITHNVIRDFYKGIYIGNPYNVEISYNKIFRCYEYEGEYGAGGGPITCQEDGLNDAFDTEYTLHIHHNELYEFEHTALWLGSLSRVLVEYNYIHDNLDERLFFGGMKSGSIGKFWDNTHQKIGSLGNIFRYNYIENLKKFGEPGYKYSRPSPSQIESGIIVVLSNNTGSEYPIYANAKSDGNDYLGMNGNAISGQGYGNVWIHNNLWNNTSGIVFSKGRAYYGDDTSSDLMPFKEYYASYFINNTLLNVGNAKHITSDNGVIYVDAKSQSPHYTINNIIDFTNIDARAASRYQRKNNFVDFNIYLRSGGSISTVPPNYPSLKSDYSTWFEYSNNKNNATGDGEKYKVNPNWSDINKKIFAANIGVSGVYIPDVRIIVGGNANNTGMDYDLIGDNYTVLGQTHKKGKDPTGRSLAYDILGNYRNTNDIGAFGSTDGSVDIITPGETVKPVITKQPIDITVKIGDDVQLDVEASCEDPIGYQWWKSPYISDSESKIVDNSKYSGATSKTLSIKNVQAEDGNISYMCEVYNTKDRSNLWVNSNSASMAINSDVGGLIQGKGTRIYLEGAYSNGKMNSFLQKSQSLPSTQPYEKSPWNINNQNGLSSQSKEIVDWILIELRDGLSNTSYAKTALLLEDGKVINSDGSDFSFSNINSAEYYLIIRHRNHLDIMSSQKIKIENNVKIDYDFTISQELVFGTNSLSKLGDGKLAMIAGDTDANNVVNNLDFGIVANNIPLKGYSQGDLDMNGIVNVLDYTFINKNIFKRSYVPQ